MGRRGLRFEISEQNKHFILSDLEWGKKKRKILGKDSSHQVTGMPETRHLQAFMKAFSLCSSVEE